MLASRVEDALRPTPPDSEPVLQVSEKRAEEAGRTWSCLPAAKTMTLLGEDLVNSSQSRASGSQEVDFEGCHIRSSVSDQLLGSAPPST